MRKIPVTIASKKLLKIWVRRLLALAMALSKSSLFSGEGKISLAAIT
jgi:hypothetical protein